MAEMYFEVLIKPFGKTGFIDGLSQFALCIYEITIDGKLLSAVFGTLYEGMN